MIPRPEEVLADSRAASMVEQGSGPWYVRYDEDGEPAALCRDSCDILHIVPSARTLACLGAVLAVLDGEGR